MNNKNVTELPADISPYVRVGMNSIQIITASMMVSLQSFFFIDYMTGTNNIVAVCCSRANDAKAAY
jgi:hypothetical protein